MKFRYLEGLDVGRQENAERYRSSLRQCTFQSHCDVGAQADAPRITRTSVLYEVHVTQQGGPSTIAKYMLQIKR